MKRIIVIILLSLILAGSLIYEQIFINDSVTLLKTKCQDVYDTIHQSANINDESIIKKVSELNDFWSNRESQLCLIINHKDMEKVGEQIVKVLTLCKQNDTKQAIYEVDLLKYYTDGYEHIIKVTFQNIW